MKPLVLKFGGELLEDAHRLAGVVSAVKSLIHGGSPLVIVHGGGKEIDTALAGAGIEKQQVDGLRITDDRTLDVVVCTVAGLVNTRFVATLNAAGIRAVGLTGADVSCGLSTVAPRHRAADGRLVDLGRVGVPVAHTETDLLETLVNGRFVPVIACIGMDQDGKLLNINADTLAGHLAARLDATRLVIAGATPGVLDSDGRTMPTLEASDITDLVAGGTATAGMIAKLRACEHALAHHVRDVVIVDGRNPSALEAAARGQADARMTRLVLMALLDESKKSEETART
ncbi:MAG TPA: acetylglutamate kinase [Vicinamibacterales bacterium]|nr:acetylglutamate kinase [Vicinamibacterales bacterium]